MSKSVESNTQRQKISFTWHTLIKRLNINYITITDAPGASTGETPCFISPRVIYNSFVNVINAVAMLICIVYNHFWQEFGWARLNFGFCKNKRILVNGQDEIIYHRIEKTTQLLLFSLHKHVSQKTSRHIKFIIQVC